MRACHQPGYEIGSGIAQMLCTGWGWSQSSDNGFEIVQRLASVKIWPMKLRIFSDTDLSGLLASKMIFM